MEEAKKEYKCLLCDKYMEEDEIYYAEYTDGYAEYVCEGCFYKHMYPKSV